MSDELAFLCGVFLLWAIGATVAAIEWRKREGIARARAQRQHEYIKELEGASVTLPEHGFCNTSRSEVSSPVEIWPEIVE